MKRNLSRIKALFALYQYDLLKNEDNIEAFNEEFPKLLEEVNLENNSNDKFEYDEKFALELYSGVINNLSDLDRTIAISLTNYPLDRLSYVDRNLIRIGVYEIVYLNEPKNVIINEIVNLSKEYSQTEDFLSSKFNNKLLDNICKRLGK